MLTPFEYFLIFAAVTGIILAGGVWGGRAAVRFIEAFEAWLKDE